MATYYRWRKSTVSYKEISSFFPSKTINANVVYQDTNKPSAANGVYTMPSSAVTITADGYMHNIGGYFTINSRTSNTLYNSSSITFNSSGSTLIGTGRYTQYTQTATEGTFVEYVYSTSSSAYPDGGVQDGYYYDQRTTVSSPVMTAPDYPNPITTQTVTVTWEEGTSNIPSAPIDHYEFLWDNGMGNGSVKVGNATSYQFNIPAGTTSIQFGIKAVDTNGYGTLAWGNTVVVYTSPTLTVPQMVMQGQQATISWTAIEGADSYTVQRKANTDSDWVQVYSGGNTTFSETVGTWTTVQYRVQAVFDGTGGGWAESNSIPVISASALVISGSDSDLGTLIDDVQYTINTDTGNQITAKVTVNSAVVFSGNVTSGAASTISIFDLVNGTGTIVIEASVQASSGVINATRTWTYTKAELTFPDTGSIAQLHQKGKNIFPKTLAECVRLPGGRTLDEVMGFPAQVYAGSYVGVGGYGSSKANTLTFPFKPKLVLISRADTQSTLNVFICYVTLIFGCTRAASTQVQDNGASTGISGRMLSVSWDDNTVSFYCTSAAGNANYQLNESGITYNYIAIG